MNWPGWAPFAVWMRWNCSENPWGHPQRTTHAFFYENLPQKLYGWKTSKLTKFGFIPACTFSRPELWSRSLKTHSTTFTRCKKHTRAFQRKDTKFRRAKMLWRRNCEPKSENSKKFKCHFPIFLNLFHRIHFWECSCGSNACFRTLCARHIFFRGFRSKMKCWRSWRRRMIVWKKMRLALRKKRKHSNFLWLFLDKFCSNVDICTWFSTKCISKLSGMSYWVNSKRAGMFRPWHIQRWVKHRNLTTWDWTRQVWSRCTKI